MTTCHGEILYEECNSRLGEVISRKASIRAKGRKEKEIEDLVADKGVSGSIGRKQKIQRKRV